MNGILCNRCERNGKEEEEYKTACDILHQIQHKADIIADMYAIRLSIKIYECTAYKEDK